MNIVFLSGGSGKRLWPLSNDIRSKQFIPFFKKEDGSFESMIQRVYRQIKSVDENASITIATSESQVSSIKNQLGQNVDISIEPCRRDTFPAIALSIAYLKYEKHLFDDEVVIVCPVDPYVNADYFEKLKELEKAAKNSNANLSLMGITPTYPSDRYGYIIPKDDSDLSLVSSFKEKPNKELAKEFISQGALWNAGVFAFKVGFLLKIAHTLIDFDDYRDLFEKYETLEKISFDFAVVEKEKNIQVLRFDGEWKDVGTWNTLCETIDEVSIGNCIKNDSCENVHMINELDIPVLAIGLKDIVLSASPDGILVADKEQASQIKSFVDKFDNETRFIEKAWGTITVLDSNEKTLTRKLCISENKTIYNKVDKKETLTCVLGSCKIQERELNIGDSITVTDEYELIALSNTEIINVIEK